MHLAVAFGFAFAVRYLVGGSFVVALISSVGFVFLFVCFIVLCLQFGWLVSLCCAIWFGHRFVCLYVCYGWVCNLDGLCVGVWLVSGVCFGFMVWWAGLCGGLRVLFDGGLLVDCLRWLVCYCGLFMVRFTVYCLVVISCYVCEYCVYGLLLV